MAAADRPRRRRRRRPGRGDRVLRPGLRDAMRAPGDQRGAGRTGGDARRRARPPTGGCIQLLAPLTPGVHDREVPRPQRAGPAAARLHGRRRRRDLRRAAGPRAAAALRHPAPWHRRLPDQLRAPEGRRWRVGGTGRACRQPDALTGVDARLSPGRHVESGCPTREVRDQPATAISIRHLDAEPEPPDVAVARRASSH